MTVARRIRLPALAVALAVALASCALAAHASAAAPAPAREAAAMRAAVTGFVAPVAPEYLPGMRVRRSAVSSRDARFAALWLDMPYAGRQVAYLRRARGAWRVLDIGPARVGCGVVPDAVLADLGGRCPDGA